VGTDFNHSGVVYSTPLEGGTMPVVILSCDEQQAQDICSKWLQEPAGYINCIVKYETSSIPVEGPPRTWLSFKCKPEKAAETRAITVMGGCLLLCLLLILLLPPFVIWAGKLSATSTPFIKLLVVIGLDIGLGLPFLITLLSPLYTLGRLYRLCHREESQLFGVFLVDGVDCNVLNPGDHWTWFPDDSYIIMFGFLGIACIRWLTAFNVWNVLQLFYPILPILLVFFILLVLRTIMYVPLKNISHLPLFWKIKVTALVDVSAIFYFPIFFYLLLLIVGHITLFILIVPYAILQNHSISEIATILTTLSSDSWIIHSIKQLGGLDEFSRFFASTSSNFHFEYTVYAEWAVGAGIFLGLFHSTRSIFQPKALDILQWKLRELPEDMVFKGSHPLVHGALLLEWLLEGWIAKFAGIAIGLGCLLVIFLPSELVAGQWSIPFLWYQASFQIFLGIVAGRIIANALLLLAIAPMLFWLLLWFIALIRDCGQFLGLLFSRQRKRDKKVQTIMSDLCKTLHIHQPIVRLVQNATGWPSTTFFLPIPMFSVIHLPTGLITELTQPELRLVLAHELGHVTKHAWKVWWLQVLSRLSLNGPGYLTLFLDYWRMEMEADMFAVQLTGDRRELITLLEQKKLKGRLLVLSGKQGDSNTLEAKNVRSHLMQHAWVDQLVKTYNLHFGDPFWGVFHPPEEERVKNLYNFVFKRENLGSPDRYTEQAKVVIERTRVEARRFQNDSIRTEHLLLGLLHEDSIIKMLRDVSANPDLVPQDIEQFMKRGKSLASDTIDFLPFTKKVLVRAAVEASLRNQPSIGPDHLLLGILQEQNSLAVKILKRLNVDLEKLRMAIAILEEPIQHKDMMQSDPTLLSSSLKGEENSDMETTIESLTEQAERVITYAKEEARRLQHHYIGTEHLLLGLLRESEGIAAQVLSSLGVKLDKVRSAVEFIIGRGTHPIEGEINLTPRAQKVMKLAGDEADRLNHNAVGTEHILVGIVREREGIAAGILESLVESLEKIQEATLAAIEQGQAIRQQPQVVQALDVTQQTSPLFSEEQDNTEYAQGLSQAENRESIQKSPTGADKDG
jgi:Zn-dependent protease with chaperone function